MNNLNEIFESQKINLETNLYFGIKKMAIGFQSVGMRLADK